MLPEAVIVDVRQSGTRELFRCSFVVNKFGGVNRFDLANRFGSVRRIAAVDRSAFADRFDAGRSLFKLRYGRPRIWRYRCSSIRWLAGCRLDTRRFSSSFGTRRLLLQRCARVFRLRFGQTRSRVYPRHSFGILTPKFW
jgi:hypothetical protein